MAKGMVRKIDELGRITIPKEIRKSFEITDKDPLGMWVDNGVIRLSKADDKFRGIARELDELGRLTLPVECRRSMGYEERQKVDIYVEGEEICIRKEGCEWCGCTEHIIEVKGHLMCNTCAGEVASTLAIKILEG